MAGATDWEKGLVQHGRALATHSVVPGAGTLQAALNTASAGDELVLADGTYTGSGSNVLDIGKNITIRALNPGQAILDGENTRRVIFITIGTVALNGLNITKGSASFVSVCSSIEPSQTFFHCPVDVTDVSFCFTGWRHFHLSWHCEHQ